MDKRTFLKSLATLTVGGVYPASAMDSLLSSSLFMDPAKSVKDEDFWREVRKGYRLKPDYINLENGYYCMQPEYTLEKFIEQVRYVNFEASWYMRNYQWDNKDKIAGRLAEIGGCSTEELIITRNTTESLDMVIGGFPWQEGDEAVMAEQDYGAMLNHFELQEEKHGIVRKVVSVPTHPQNDEEIVRVYEEAITPKTKLLMVCHIINITGQILPIKKICRMAHAKGVEVMVDGAHAFGHFQFSIPELECDYYGSSLHKWLSVPLGAGILYVRKGKANEIWPLLAENKKKDNTIGRLNHIGTHPVHTDLAIEYAIEYQNKLGASRKEERLRYIQQYWTSKARMIPNVVVNTPADPKRHCAIGNVGIRGIEPKELAERFLSQYGIYTVAIDYAGIKGCRITPNVYTTLEELDTLIEALKEMAAA